MRCGASLCRVEATHASLDAQEEYVERLRLLDDVAREGVAFSGGGGEDDPRSVVFVARTGHALEP